MEDEADVRLVDPHPEGDGGDDDLDAVVRHDGGLDGLPLGRAHAGVVGGGRDAPLAEGGGDLVGGPAGGGVDDAWLGAGGDPIEESRAFGVGVAERLDRERDVRPVEAGDDDGWSAHAEPLDDLGPNGRRCGGGEGNDGRVAEPLDDAAEPEVGRPEIVPPLADAVSLVDDEERGLDRDDIGDGLVAQEVLRGETTMVGPGAIMPAIW